MRESKQGLSKLGWVFAVVVAMMLGGVSVAAQSAEPVHAAPEVHAASQVQRWLDRRRWLERWRVIG